MTNVIFTKEGYQTRTVVIFCALGLCMRARARVWTHLLVPDDGHNGFWPPQCEWLTQSSCSIWNAQSNATREPSCPSSHQSPATLREPQPLHYALFPLWIIWQPADWAKDICSLYYNTHASSFSKSPAPQIVIPQNIVCEAHTQLCACTITL